jgi:putative pyruvate formate lyase activating enzyme
MKPSYFSFSSIDLEARAQKAWQLLTSCCLCPRRCRVNRLKGEKGFCQMGKKPKIFSFHPHFGEEKCLVGSRGSGTIFFSSCNLACVYWRRG